MNRNKDNNITERGAREIFIVIADKITFIGILISKNNGKYKIHGYVKFDDGHTWYFSSPLGDQNALRQNLLTISRRIARAYGANVMHKRLDR
ncbi:MAG: hypothetical protein JRI37_01410 [Deltaproteobacteria bacterium]|nr:hypothetical protein [Deltaproteobacteria bacterium]